MATLALAAALLWAQTVKSAVVMPHPAGNAFDQRLPAHDRRVHALTQAPVCLKARSGVGNRRWHWHCDGFSWCKSARPPSCLDRVIREQACLNLLSPWPRPHGMTFPAPRDFSPQLYLGRKRLPSRPVPVPARVFLLLKNKASAAIRNCAVELLVWTPCETLRFDDMVQLHFQKN